MSLTTYLEERSDYYVLQEFSNIHPGVYNAPEKYSAILRKSLDIKDNIERSLNFFSDNSDSVLESIDNALNKLETKLQIIRDNAIFLNKIKLELASTSNEFDISVIDLSKGKLDNVSYSSIDKGVILETSSSIGVTRRELKPFEVSSTFDISNVTNYNIMIILDRSGSMGQTVAGGMTRLNFAIDAISAMLDSYNSLNSVAVRVVTFDGVGNSLGAIWTDVDSAKALLQTVTDGGSTNFVAGVTEAMSSFDSPGKLSDSVNISYFFTDGAGGILNSSQEEEWHLFLKQNDINSLSVAIGPDSNTNLINEIAYNGIDEVDTDAIQIINFEELEQTLTDNIIVRTEGNLLGDLNSDNHWVDVIEIGNAVYRYIPTIDDNRLAVFGLYGTGYNFDENTALLEIYGENDFELIVNMETGEFTYRVESTFTIGDIESFEFTIRRESGEKSKNKFTITRTEIGLSQEYISVN